LRVTVIDSESVTERARRKIAAAGLSTRIDTRVGDCFRDPFPAGTDAILLAHMVTIWSPERNTRLLMKCRECLPSGGRVFIFNMVSRDDETGPLINALGSPYFQAIATGEGMIYCEKDIRAWLRAAGFAHVRRVPLPFEHGLFEAVKRGV
jgi:cyclopropane fatty-acyl-phospholipid synthase-like methyltransferase